METMTWSIPEKDWKKLRSLKLVLLNQACESILEKISTVMEKRKGHEHETYLKIWDIMHKEDKAISMMFDDFKRSNAIYKLAHLRYHKVVSDEDFETFSEETKHMVSVINGE